MLTNFISDLLIDTNRVRPTFVYNRAIVTQPTSVLLRMQSNTLNPEEPT